jgi:AraC-like DNA-binding protein
MRTAIFNTEACGVCEADASTPIQSLYVYIAPEKILDLFGKENRHAAARLLSRTKEEHGYARPGMMRPAMKTIVHEIFHCRFHGVARKIFVAGKILELLAHEIDDADAPCAQAVHLGGKDIQQLQKARTIMMENMASPPSIEALARMVGLNQKKIKLGFRRLYNTTVFGFLRQYRMEQARMLFETQRASVTEAACAVGYTNISHFGAAFRNHFGIRPSDYLKTCKSGVLPPNRIR